ncbi:hypothetical protein DFH27DRAFT_501372 [Peziza echinospora]|nr:hypothetical protein DFH27DRAFT_501372 [Peziza echinospora]
MAPLRIGYIPEHFSIPIHLLLKSLPPNTITLHPYPSGTGHLITSLNAHTIDLAIGLTEGFIAHLRNTPSPSFRIIGSYVNSPLRWAISTGGSRDDINSISDLRGKDGRKGKLGISRVGSGSYVMGYVLADREGWVSGGGQGGGEKKKEDPFEFVVLNDFKGLRDGVNDGRADAFLWEYFTSKKYYTTPDPTSPPSLKHIGDIPTPWPSWQIVAHTSLLPPSPSPSPTLSLLLKTLNTTINTFSNPQNRQTSIALITESAEMEYSAQDAAAWFETVEFVDDTRVVREEVVRGCVEVLERAGVCPVEGWKGLEVGEMVVEV